MPAVDAKRNARSSTPHAYPRDLARLVRAAWNARSAGGHIAPPPALPALETLLSVSYQASLLREEGRAVTFRLAVANPSQFPDATGPPDGLHRLLLSRPRTLDAQELRRLAPAADAARALIGVRISRKGVHVWGLLHAGVQWLPETADDSSTLLLVSVAGPGHLVVTLGGAPLAELGHGRLGTSDVDAFESPVMLASFGGLAAAMAASSAPRPSDDGIPELASRLAGLVLRRAVATMRAGRHGGMLIVLPAGRIPSLMSDGSLRTKYEFVDDPSRRRAQVIATDLVRALALEARPGASLWSRFLKGRSASFREPDLALLEFSHLISGLSQVDGAVVMTDTLDIVGFGAEIGGHLQPVQRVMHALDLPGTARGWVRADRVGTRHRSAYRLCLAVPEALVLVVSQDGGLRVIHWHVDAVTYWAQVARGHWEG